MFLHSFTPPLRRSTLNSVYVPHRVTSWIVADEGERTASKLSVGLVDYQLPNDSAYRSTLNFRAYTSPLIYPSPLSAPLSPAINPHEGHTDLIVHPTMAKVARPRYVMVRGRVYIPPRSALDNLDNWFEPIIEKPLVFLYSGRISLIYPVAKEGLWSLGLVVVLLNFLGVTVTILCASKPWMLSE